MCIRYFRDSDINRLKEAFHIGDDKNLPLEIAPSYNIAPTTMQPVVRCNPGSTEREMVAMRWGMVPHFAKNLADFKGLSTFNARAETLTTSAAWRGPFQRSRCLVPASGYYEWKKLDAKTKQPYAIAMTSREPFAFAGLWDAWKDPATGYWLQSFALVTTTPNELTATIHNRMPAIVGPQDYQRWLDLSSAPPFDLLNPFPSNQMRAWPVGAQVGNVSNNSPNLLDEVEDTQQLVAALFPS